MLQNLLKSKIVWLVVALLVVIGVGWKLNLIPGNALPARLLGQPAQSEYQAVFLTNNQVYFGKLYDENSDYPVLKDVFYLQVTQVLQPKEPDAPAQQINLVKLGGELHGPMDEMKINKDHILFIEDLKPDSQVVAGIKNYKK